MASGFVAAAMACASGPTVVPTTAPATSEGLSATDRIWLGISRGMAQPQAPAAGEDPMRAVSGGMADIARDLDAELTGKPVQAKQAQVLSQLDVLIKELEKQTSGSGSGGGLNPSKPMAKSSLAGGPGGINDLHDPKASEKQWGALKPKEREQILQSKTDGFPQGYESLLQTYYRRMANEESAPSETQPTVQPESPAKP